MLTVVGLFLKASDAKKELRRWARKSAWVPFWESGNVLGGVALELGLVLAAGDVADGGNPLLPVLVCG